jgi:hypothetical protein
VHIGNHAVVIELFPDAIAMCRAGRRFSSQNPDFHAVSD